MEYEHRLNAFHRRRTWVIESDALSWSEAGGTSERIPYQEIDRLQLSFSPTRTEEVRAVLRIQTARGSHAIASMDYRGPLSASDCRREFVAFCEALHAALLAAPGQVEYLLGWTPAGYRACQFLCILLGAADLVVGGFLWSEDMRGRAAVTIVMGLLLLARLWSLTKSNRPARYDSGQIPWDTILSMSQ